jgi:hypothetical protein
MQYCDSRITDQEFDGILHTDKLHLMGVIAINKILAYISVHTTSESS